MKVFRLNGKAYKFDDSTSDEEAFEFMESESSPAPPSRSMLPDTTRSAPSDASYAAPMGQAPAPAPRPPMTRDQVRTQLVNQGDGAARWPSTAALPPDAGFIDQAKAFGQDALTMPLRGIYANISTPLGAAQAAIQGKPNDLYDPARGFGENYQYNLASGTNSPIANDASFLPTMAIGGPTEKVASSIAKSIPFLSRTAPTRGAAALAAEGALQGAQSTLINQGLGQEQDYGTSIGVGGVMNLGVGGALTGLGKAAGFLRKGVAPTIENLTAITSGSQIPEGSLQDESGLLFDPGMITGDERQIAVEGALKTNPAFGDITQRRQGWNERAVESNVMDLRQKFPGRPYEDVGDIQTRPYEAGHSLYRAAQGATEASGNRFGERMEAFKNQPKVNPAHDLERQQAMDAMRARMPAEDARPTARLIEGAGGPDVYGKVSMRSRDEMPTQMERAAQRQRTLYQGEEPAPAEPPAKREKSEPFYSPLRELIRTKMGRSMPVKDLLNLVKKGDSGIKQDELQWTGFEKWLESKTMPPEELPLFAGQEQNAKTPSVTREEVLTYLDENGIKIRNVNHGDFDKDSLAYDKELAKERMDGFPKGSKEWNAARKDFEDLERASYMRSRFKKYIKEGDDNFKGDLDTAEDYREDVLYWDRPQALRKDSGAPQGARYELEEADDDGVTRYFVRDARTGERVTENEHMPHSHSARSAFSNRVDLSKGHVSRDEIQKHVDELNEVDSDRSLAVNVMDEFREGHYAEPDVVMHSRSVIRKTPDGKSALDLEEMQSDWAHKLSREGSPGQKPADLAAKEKLNSELDALYAKRSSPEFAAKDEQRIAQVKKALGRLDKRIKEGNYNIPEGPYVGDTKKWFTLGLKKAIRRAAEMDLDYITLNTGKQTAVRNHVGRAVDSIEWVVNEDGDVKLTPKKNKGEVTSRDLDFGKFKTKAEARAIIGEELADRIYAKASEGELSGTLDTVDFEVGGEGRKELYDKMFPQAIRDYVKKKWNVDLEEIEVEVQPAGGNIDDYEIMENDPREHGDPIGYRLVDRNGRVLDYAERKEDLYDSDKWPREPDYSDFDLVELTREEAAKAGFDVDDDEAEEFWAVVDYRGRIEDEYGLHTSRDEAEEAMPTRLKDDGGVEIEDYYGDIEYYIADPVNGGALDEEYFESQYDARRYLERNKSAILGKSNYEAQKVKQIAFRVTPEMKEEALYKGQPLLQPEKGSYRPAKTDAPAQVELYPGADMSTVIHEIAGHDYAHRLLKATDRKAFEAYYQSQKNKTPLTQAGKWTRDMHEYFAQAMEGALMRGQVEGDAIRQPAARAAVRLRQIYDEKDLPELSPALQKTVSKMLKPKQIVENLKQKVTSKAIGQGTFEVSNELQKRYDKHLEDFEYAGEGTEEVARASADAIGLAKHYRQAAANAKSIKQILRLKASIGRRIMKGRKDGLFDNSVDNAFFDGLYGAMNEQVETIVKREMPETLANELVDLYRLANKEYSENRNALTRLSKKMNMGKLYNAEEAVKRLSDRRMDETILQDIARAAEKSDDMKAIWGELQGAFIDSYLHKALITDGGSKNVYKLSHRKLISQWGKIPEGTKRLMFADGGERWSKFLDKLSTLNVSDERILNPSGTAIQSAKWAWAKKFIGSPHSAFAEAIATKLLRPKVERYFETGKVADLSGLYTIVDFLQHAEKLQSKALRAPITQASLRPKDKEERKEKYYED